MFFGQEIGKRAPAPGRPKIGADPGGLQNSRVIFVSVGRVQPLSRCVSCAEACSIICRARLGGLRRRRPRKRSAIPGGDRASTGHEWWQKETNPAVISVLDWDSMYTLGISNAARLPRNSKPVFKGIKRPPSQARNAQPLPDVPIFRSRCCPKLPCSPMPSTTPALILVRCLQAQ